MMRKVRTPFGELPPETMPRAWPWAPYSVCISPEVYHGNTTEAMPGTSAHRAGSAVVYLAVTTGF